jgi:L-ascorbate metabolism protein UlaG (beta-lactamase superfamily)
MKNTSLITVVVLLSTWFGTLAAQPADAMPEKPAGPVSPAMSLAEIERALPRYPPAWEHSEARAAIATSLDRQVTVQVRDGMTDEDRAKLQPLLEFYRRRVDAGLEALERTRVTDGVLVVKFYSSSLVLKSAAGTVAVDFCQGPINNGGEPETRDDRRTGFFWTAEQRDRLARLVDVSLITHRHHDHADCSLSRRLAARGKPVVGPSQLKALWKDLADGITVPQYGQGQQVGPAEFYTLLGRQYSRSTPGADGQREGVPGADPANETESVVYLLRVGGIVFLQGAENHVPAGEWLKRGIAQGWVPDVVLSAGQYQGQRSIDAVLRQRPPVFRIPVHDYEMMHEGGGNRTTPWFTGPGRQAFDRRQAMPLFWGESFPLTRAQLGATSGSPLRPQSETSAEVLVEAEAFAERGGWLLDPQFVDQMGSPYLLAHGLGKPVANAKTEIEFPANGRYHVWVRAKDWVRTHHPGLFRVLVGGRTLEPTFGQNGRDWSWQSGGYVDVTTRKATVELQDLTGFDGRCDAIYFTTKQDAVPPHQADEAMAAWRRKLLGLPESPAAAGDFDVVVAGGGIAGCATALTAARLGAKVALIQDRPVLGGNASDEIGLTPRGAVHSIVSEISPPGRERVLQAHPNLKLFLDWHAFRVQKAGTRIAGVDAKHTTTNRELRFQAPVFVDCTGVGAVGFLAGAEYRLGREARTEFNESLAPPKADKMHHGNSPVFRTRQAERPVTFPEVPWAVAVAGDYADLGGQVLGPCRDNVGGLTHFWEYGQWLDPFADAERIRDHLLCAVYGTFANAKRKAPMQSANLELEFVGHVLASGESRRLMGDYVLTENDIREQRAFPDSVANQSGHFCLHYPGDNHDFRLGDWKWIAVQPYSVSFRCLYSRNVDNLLMAGKHISVTHVAGSSTKTMLNGGQHGVAAGAAAFLCKKHATTPRGVYRQHLQELQDIVFGRNEHANDLKR